MEDKGGKFLESAGILLATIAASIVGTILAGKTLSVLWDWFVIPVFKLPELSTAYAIGIAIIVGYMAGSYNYSAVYSTTTEENKGKWALILSKILHILLMPLYLLFVGYIVHQFV